MSHLGLNAEKANVFDIWAGEILSYLGRVSLFVLFSSLTNWIESTNKKEDNLLYLFYSFKC